MPGNVLTSALTASSTHPSTAVEQVSGTIFMPILQVGKIKE